MVTKAVKGEGVKSYCIEDLTPREMEQMCEMRFRIHEILESHKSASEKRMYLSDDELFVIEAMLQVLTGPYTVRTTSDFDNMKKQLIAVYNKSNVDTPSEETKIKCGICNVHGSI